jgi:hypothetical protein
VEPVDVVPDPVSPWFCPPEAQAEAAMPIINANTNAITSALTHVCHPFPNFRQIWVISKDSG